MLNRKRSFFSKIGMPIFLIIAFFVLVKLYMFYQDYNFSNFVKATAEMNKTTFLRDKDIKFSETNSYKMQSDEFNDAVFYKEIEVRPNTPYKVTCMVKTEDVIPENKVSASGAQICIVDTTECSESYTGTNDWRKLEFLFDSKNRDKVKIGFRLGGNTDNVKGKVWFADFKLEEGLATTDTNWHAACFMFKHIDVNLNNEEVKLDMGTVDIAKMKSNLERFKNSCKELSGNRMTISYDVYEIDEPITSISYSEEYGYYVDAVDIKETLEKYLKNNEYDHIFAVIRMGSEARNIEIPVNDWIGLRKHGIPRNRLF